MNNKKYVGGIDEKVIKRLVGDNPTLRTSLGKLLDGNPYASLTEEERDLLHSIGLISIRSPNKIKLEEIHHRPEATVSYLYELDSDDYIKIRSIVKYTETLYTLLVRNNQLNFSTERLNFFYTRSSESLLSLGDDKDKFEMCLEKILSFFNTASDIMKEVAIISSYKNKSIQIKSMSEDMLKFRIKDCLVGVGLSVV